MSELVRDGALLRCNTSDLEQLRAWRDGELGPGFVVYGTLNNEPTWWSRLLALPDDVTEADVLATWVPEIAQTPAEPTFDDVVQLLTAEHQDARMYALNAARLYPERAHDVWLFALLDCDTVVRQIAGSYLFSYDPSVPDNPDADVLLAHLADPERSVRDFGVHPPPGTLGPWDPARGRANKRRGLLWVMEWLAVGGIEVAPPLPDDEEDPGLGAGVLTPGEVLRAALADTMEWTRAAATAASTDDG